MDRTPPKNFVRKRGGGKEQVHLDKITSRIQKLCYGLNLAYVDPLAVTLKVINGLYPGITTTELDNAAAETAAAMAIQHPDYGTLAARIAISNLHKQTKKKFSDVIKDLYNAQDETTGKPLELISKTHYTIIMENAERLNSCIMYDRDFNYDYFGFKLMEHFCLLRINGKVVERPQHMLMRVAVGIHWEDIESAVETYSLMSEKYFIHASTTLCAAARSSAQLCSSFAVAMPEDSLEGIFKCITDCGLISETVGGIGVSIHNIRATSTPIAGTKGVSNGLVPMLRVFNNLALFVDQGGRDKTGGFTIHLEPWHADIFDVLELKKRSGKEEYRARDLSYALWVPDLFMKRVKADERWSLMCPNQAPGLFEAYGDEFEKLYEKYESQGMFNKEVRARDLWRAICLSQIETGGPHILYKDACNLKTSHKNLGTLKSSGLHADILAYTSAEESAAVCMASIALNAFVSSDRKTFDFAKLKYVAKVVTRNLNKIIDVAEYPVPECQNSSLKNRPVGLGVQGLADVFLAMRMPYESAEARLLNTQIFETIYYGALEASCELAESQEPYTGYKDSPISQGILQYDMWNVTPTNLWDWAQLKEKIAKHGVRNSLLISLMPTSTTAPILGNNFSTEPYTSYVTSRRVLSTEFRTINPYLYQDLSAKNLWIDTVYNQIFSEDDGSIQNIPEIPEDLKRIYRTAWEISQKAVIEMAADRGAFVDQSQAMNVYLACPNYGTMSSMHFYGWQKNLKTGMNQLRTMSNFSPQQFVFNPLKVSKTVVNETTMNGGGEKDSKEEDIEIAKLICSRQNPENCLMCGA